MLKAKHWKRLAEFFVIGLLFGIAEDLMAIASVSETVITWRVLGIVFLIALPFAVVSELIVDGKDLFRHHRAGKLRSEAAGGQRLPEV